MTQIDYLVLVDRAKKQSYEYYVLSQPSVSDSTFDALVTRIEQIEQEHPDWITPDSPTQCVGSDLSANGRRLIRHRTPMLSCQKASTDQKGTNREKLQAWMDKTEKTIGHNHFSYTLEWKYDGISCSLVYLNGQLISAATRGDGRVGQDITAHAQYIQDIPQRLQKGTTYHGRVEVRGEILLPNVHLALTSDNSGKPYTDCRTAASSLCNQQVPDPSQCALLVFRPWNYEAPLFSLRNSHYECMKLAEWMQFKGQTYRFDAADHNALFDWLTRMEEQRDSIPFPVDGLVVKVDDKELAASLGATEHHPKGSIAYKFVAQKNVTRCTRIEVTVGKTGKHTPVVHFEPVTILGRTVHKASVGSEATLQKLGIRMGDTIEVGLANDVRPTVYRVIASANNQTVEVTENDPLDGIDFPGPVADDEYAAPLGSVTDDGPVCGDSIATPEPKWLAPSLFADNEAIVPEDSPSGNDTVPADSVSGNEAPLQPLTASEQPKRSAFVTVLLTITTAICMTFAGMMAMGIIAFCLPVVSGTLIKSSIH